MRDLRVRIVTLYLLFFCLFSLYGESPQLDFHAEFLLLKPTLDNDFIDAASENHEIPFNLQPSGPGKRNRFGYKPAFRVIGCYNDQNACCWTQNCCLRFTYLTGKDDRRLRLPRNRAFLRAKHQLNYYGSDLYSAIQVFNQYCLQFAVQPGIHFAFVHYKSKVDVSALTANLDERSSSWGLGPELGFVLKYALPRRLLFQTTIRGGMLVSNAKSRFHTNPETDLGNPRTLIKVFPFWEIAVSLGACFSVNGFPAEVKIGYEYLSYPNFINRVQFPDIERRNKTGNLLTNVDFYGPFLSALVSF